jgi:hypothetical protein
MYFVFCTIDYSLYRVSPFVMRIRALNQLLYLYQNKNKGKTTHHNPNHIFR